MHSLFLTLFIVVSLIHLYGSFIGNQRVRNATKGAILLCLLGFYLSGTNAPDPVFTAALVFSFLGDVLLMFRRGFLPGGVSFGISQLCLIAAFSRSVRLSGIPVWFWFGAAVYIAALLLVLRAVRACLSKKLFPVCVLYLSVNTLMNLFALLQLASVPGRPAALVCVGAALFLLSDCLLVFVRFSRTVHIPHRHFPVMLTYISAVFLITLGMLGLHP